MYEKYFNKLREECLIRNRSSRTADTYINNINHWEMVYGKGTENDRKQL